MLKHNLAPDLGAAQVHLRMLTDEDDPTVAWQTFPDHDRGRNGLARSYHGRLAEVLPRLREAQALGCGVFVAVNETDGKGRKMQNITRCRAVFLDLDGAPLPSEWPERPTMVMQSSNGAVAKFQCWWAIEPTDEIEAWTAFQKLLAERYGGDLKCALLTQVGRAAGFYHQKDADAPWQVRVIEDRSGDLPFVGRLSLRELAVAFGFDVDAAPALTDRERLKIDKPANGWDNEPDVKRATQFVTDAANWTTTSDGGVSVFKMACTLRDVGISPELAEELIAAHVPVLPAEWSPDHIEKKVENAYRYASGNAGERSATAAAADFEDDLVQEPGDRHSIAGLTFLRADEVTAKPLRPLWPGRIYIGKLTTGAGIPDQGKSVVTCDISARVSRGLPWPDGRGNAPLGDVIILSAEDDPEDTIVPRLMAAGAAMERIYILNSLVRDGKGKRMLNIADDLVRLTKFVTRHPETRLLIIDPANAYMGTSKENDSFRDSDVRAVLGPVKEWAEEHQIAVLIITHFKKGGTGRAIDQVMGSLAFTALSRSAWAFIEEKDKDGESTGRKLMAKIKQNIAGPVDALAYTLVGVQVTPDISAPRVEWGGEVKGSADDIMGGAKARPGQKLMYAVSFLQSELADGPVAAAELLKRGQAAGFSEKTLNRAKAEIGALSEKSPAGWVWRLPEAADDCPDAVAE